MTAADTVESVLLNHLAIHAPLNLDQLAALCPDRTWNQVFAAVNQINRLESPAVYDRLRANFPYQETPRLSAESRGVPKAVRAPFGRLCPLKHAVVETDLLL